MVDTLGRVLRYYREQNHYSQGEVCNGLCSVATLARIEQGERISDSLLGESLLGRIGRELSVFELILNEEDYQLYKLREQIQTEMVRHDVDTALEQLKKYRQQMDGSPRLNEQFCLFCEVKCDVTLEKAADEIKEKALAALRLTKPQEELWFTHRQLYTQTEIELLIILLHYDFFAMDEEIEKRLLQLLHFVEQMCSQRKKDQLGLLIVSELICCIRHQQNTARALFYIDRAIGFIGKGRGIRQLDRLHFLRAQMLEKRYCGQLDIVSVKYEIQKECLMAYSICEILDEGECLAEIEHFCNEKMQWLITESVM